MKIRFPTWPRVLLSFSFSFPLQFSFFFPFSSCSLLLHALHEISSFLAHQNLDKNPPRRPQLYMLYIFLFFNSNYHLVNILPCVNAWLIVSTNLVQLLKHNVPLSSIFIDLFLTFVDLL